MFTGIVEEVGVVREASVHRLVFGAHTVLSDLTVSQSIAVNGACLTAVEVTAEAFAVDLSEEGDYRVARDALQDVARHGRCKDCAVPYGEHARAGLLGHMSPGIQHQRPVVPVGLCLKEC